MYFRTKNYMGLKNQELSFGVRTGKKCFIQASSCNLEPPDSSPTGSNWFFVGVLLNNTFWSTSLELRKPRPCAYKTFFMLNSAEHEISKLDKSNLINLLEKLLTCGHFHCFCLANQSFKFNLPNSLKDKSGF